MLTLHSHTFLRHDVAVSTLSVINADKIEYEWRGVDGNDGDGDGEKDTTKTAMTIASTTTIPNDRRCCCADHYLLADLSIYYSSSAGMDFIRNKKMR